MDAAVDVEQRAGSEPCLHRRDVDGSRPHLRGPGNPREWSRGDGRGGDIASAICLCHRYVDLLHLIRIPEGWRIVNAAWRLC